MVIGWMDGLELWILLSGAGGDVEAVGWVDMRLGGMDRLCCMIY